MKSLEQILQYKGGTNTNFIDGRDRTRLARFVPVEHWKALGVEPAEGVDPKTIEILPFTEENIKKQFAQDLAFAFSKALDKRGISASLMFDVIKMWGWVLDDEEIGNWSDDNYAQYGLPLLAAAARKYGFENPIGDDVGNEDKYSADYGY